MTNTPATNSSFVNPTQSELDKRSGPTTMECIPRNESCSTINDANDQQNIECFSETKDCDSIGLLNHPSKYSSEIVSDRHSHDQESRSLSSVDDFRVDDGSLVGSDKLPQIRIKKIQSTAPSVNQTVFLPSTKTAISHPKLDEEGTEDNLKWQRLVAIGVPADDMVRNEGSEHETKKRQSIAHCIQRSILVRDEAVAKTVAEEEHSLKMKMKRWKNLPTRRLSKAQKDRNRANDSTLVMTKAYVDNDNEEKMRTLRGRHAFGRRSLDVPRRLGSLSPSLHTAPPEQPLRRNGYNISHGYRRKKVSETKHDELAISEDVNLKAEDKDNGNRIESNRFRKQLAIVSFQDTALGNGSSNDSVSSGIDLDEKTRQRIISRSIRGSVRSKRSNLVALSNNISTESTGGHKDAQNTASIRNDATAKPFRTRPCDEKQNLQVTSKASSAPTQPFQSRSTNDINVTSFSPKYGERRPSWDKEVATNSGTGLDTRGISSITEAILTAVDCDTQFEVTECIDSEDDRVDDSLSNMETEEDGGLEVLPGAFAVDGIGDEEDCIGVSGYDSGFEENSHNLGTTDNSTDTHCASIWNGDDNELVEGIEVSTSPVIDNPPLQAQLVEEEAALEAQVLVEEDDRNVKEKIRELSLRMSYFAFGLLVIIGIAIGVVLPRVMTKNDDDSHGNYESRSPSINGWIQLGDALTAEKVYKDNIRFGNTVSISADGSRIAVGLPGSDNPADESLKSAGSVEIYDLINGTQWEKILEIFGTHTNAEFGTTVALSDDGMRVAIGAPSYDSREMNYISIYEEFPAIGSWEAVGKIEGGNGTNFGDVMGFSGDGRIIAFGDKYADHATSEDVGVVKVYRQMNGIWTKMGDDLFGSEQSDLFGWSIALSKDGYRLAASSLRNNQKPGHVRVFKFNGIGWVKLGSDILGMSIGETFGVSTEIAGDGSIIAIGATGYSKGGKEASVGVVRCFKYDVLQEDWLQYGQALTGENEFDAFGSSIALSSNGSVMAIGGPANWNFCPNCGHIQIYHKTNHYWNKSGSELGSVGMDGGQFGYDVALSKSGERVVGAAPFTTFNGFLSKIGQVIVFDKEGEEA